MANSSGRSRPEDQQREIRSLLVRAREALRRQQFGLARTHLMQALESAPECVDAWRMLGVLDHRTGHFVEAISRFRRIAEIAPDDAMAHMGLGMALHDHGESDAALASFERACQLSPRAAACWFNLGKALRSRDDDVARAQHALQRALACDPRHVPARLTLADVWVSTGEVSAASAEYRKVLAQEPANDRAWWGLASFATDSMTLDDVKRLRILLERAGFADESGIRLAFSLARALESQGQYEEAFAVLEKANAGMFRISKWDAVEERTRMDAIAKAFSRSTGKDSSGTDRGYEAVFVLSLPRSGSTLVEQILASHSEVTGGGEMLHLQQVLEGESKRRGQSFPCWVDQASEADWARMGTEYLSRSARLRGDKRYLIDKNLLNWQFVGAIARMLPGARFISVSRDRLETCLACYRQLFRTGMGFSYSLEDMIDYFRGHDELIDHWRESYPQRFMEVEYSTLVENPEDEIRRLLAFCELDFESSCLEFHRTKRVIRTASAAQIRQGLRRDTARADLYGDALQPLRKLLGRS